MYKLFLYNLSLSHIYPYSNCYTSSYGYICTNLYDSICILQRSGSHLADSANIKSYSYNLAGHDPTRVSGYVLRWYACSKKKWRS